MGNKHSSSWPQNRKPGCNGLGFQPYAMAHANATAGSDIQRAIGALGAIAGYCIKE